MRFCYTAGFATQSVLQHRYNEAGFATLPKKKDDRFCDIVKKTTIGFATRLHSHGRVHCNRVLPAKRFWSSTSCRSIDSVADLKLAAHVVLPHSWFCNTVGAATSPQQSRFCDVVKKKAVGFATRLHKPRMPQTSWLELRSSILRHVLRAVESQMLEVARSPMMEM